MVNVIDIAQLIASDPVSAPLIFVGVSASAYIAGYAVAALRRRIHPVAYVAAGLIGVAGVVVGYVIGGHIADIASANASVDDADRTPGQALALTALLWPLGWAAVAAGGALLVRRWRALFVALAIGFASSAATFVNLFMVATNPPVPAGDSPATDIAYAFAGASGALLFPYFPFLLDGTLRVVAFALSVAGALTVLALRGAGPGRGTGAGPEEGGAR
jgi:hypothetical protein